MADVEIKTQEPEQPNQPDRPSSGYSRLRNRHRELIAAHEALRNDHEVLRAAYAHWKATFNGCLSSIRE